MNTPKSNNLRTALESLITQYGKVAETEVDRDEHPRLGLMKSVYESICRDLRQALATPDAPDAERVAEIDLDAVFWDSIKKSASKSPWIPPQYMTNEWVVDVCKFLETDPAPVPGDERAEPNSLDAFHHWRAQFPRQEEWNHDYVFCAGWEASRQARAALSAPPDAWIALSTRKPTEADSDRLGRVFYWNSEVGCAQIGYGHWGYKEHSHWQPLPPPPVAGATITPLKSPWWAKCTVCGRVYKDHCGSTECCGALAYIVPEPDQPQQSPGGSVCDCGQYGCRCREGYEMVGKSIPTWTEPARPEAPCPSIPCPTCSPCAYVETPEAPEIPAGVYYNAEHRNFYDSKTRVGMGDAFYTQWRHSRDEFPSEPQPPAPGETPPS